MEEWLSQPVTRAYLEALYRFDLKWQAAGAGASPELTADQTHAAVAKREGVLVGIQNAARALALMEEFDLVEFPEETEEDTPDESD